MSDLMTLRVVRALTGLACFVVLIDAPVLIRLPPVILFSLMAPGLALTRAVPSLARLELASIVGAVSLSVIVVVSLVLLFFNAWAGATTLLGVGMVTLLSLGSATSARSGADGADSLNPSDGP